MAKNPDRTALHAIKQNSPYDEEAEKVLDDLEHMLSPPDTHDAGETQAAKEETPPAKSSRKAAASNAKSGTPAEPTKGKSKPLEWCVQLWTRNQTALACSVAAVLIVVLFYHVPPIHNGFQSVFKQFAPIAKCVVLFSLVGLVCKQMSKRGLSR